MSDLFMIFAAIVGSAAFISLALAWSMLPEGNHSVSNIIPVVSALRPVGYQRAFRSLVFSIS